MLEKKVHIADHGQCPDVAICELKFGAVIVVRNATFQWAAEYDESELWGSR